MLYSPWKVSPIDLQFVGLLERPKPGNESMGKAVPQPKVLGKQAQIEGWNDRDTVDGSEIRNNHPGMMLQPGP